MAVPPNKPAIQKSERPAGNPNQPAPRLIENPPAKTSDKALQNSQRVVGQANQAK